MNLKFEDVIRRMEVASAGSLVVPVRITAHGEDGTVLYGYGGLAYEPPNPPFPFVRTSNIMFTRNDAYWFLGDREI